MTLDLPISVPLIEESIQNVLLQVILNLIIDDSNKIYVNEENITPKYSQRLNKKVTNK